MKDLTKVDLTRLNLAEAIDALRLYTRNQLMPFAEKGGSLSDDIYGVIDAIEALYDRVIEVPLNEISVDDIIAQMHSIVSECGVLTKKVEGVKTTDQR